MSSKSLTQDETEMTDEVYEIVEATNDDGTVDVEIIDIRKEDDDVVVEFRTPTMEIKTETMDWPKRDSNEYKLVRICRRTVGSFNAIGDIDGERVPAETGTWNPETWEIHVPKEDNDNDDHDHDMVTAKEILHDIVFFSIAAVPLITVGVPVLLGFLYPFGIDILTFPQGASMFLFGVLYFSIIVTLIGEGII